MAIVIPVEGLILEHVLETTYLTSHEGLSRQTYAQFDAAQMKTDWGLRHQRRVALVEGEDVLASATQYTLAGILDGRPVRVCGIGAVFTDPAHRGVDHAYQLVEWLLDHAARDGAELALLFSEPGQAYGGRQHGFETIATRTVELRVEEASRPGAPMTLIRAGEKRDLEAIVAMGHVRAGAFRFHLDRDVDLVQYAITKRRLLAGLGSARARQLHFFIAEEGITAAAYVVISVIGGTWTIEECGDRDPSGARVGAILQALIARDPVERRPSIHAWLPSGFVPPQVTIMAARPSTDIMMLRPLGSTVVRPPLSGDDVLYWRSDLF